MVCHAIHSYKNTMRFFYLPILAFVIGGALCSCYHDKDKNIKKLSPELCLSDSDLHTPFFLAATNELLLVANTKSDTIIDVYDAQTKTMVNQFLLHGEGPKEALHLMGVQYSASDSSIYLSDPFRKLMYKVKDYKDSAPTIETIFQYGLKDEKGVQIGDWCRYLANGKIMSAGVTPNGMLTYFNPDLTDFRHLEKYPDKDLVNENLDNWANIMLYQSYSSVSPDGKHLAVVYYGADMVGVASVISEDSISVRYQKKAYPNDIYVIQYNEQSSQGAYTGKSMSNYITVTASDKYFYALYKGKRKRDCEKGLDRSTHVRCFDWNLNLITEMELDEDAYQIAVTPDDKYLYALNSSADKGYTIVKYGL